MPDNEIFNETEYIEGFNIGYKMTKEFPEFAEFLSSARGNSDKLEGMKDGRSQYLEEELEDIRPDWLKEEHYKEQNQPDKDQEIEPEL